MVIDIWHISQDLLLTDSKEGHLTLNNDVHSYTLAEDHVTVPFGPSLDPRSILGRTLEPNYFGPSLILWLLLIFSGEEPGYKLSDFYCYICMMVRLCHVISHCHVSFSWEAIAEERRREKRCSLCSRPCARDNSDTLLVHSFVHVCISKFDIKKIKCVLLNPATPLYDYGYSAVWCV